MGIGLILEDNTEKNYWIPLMLFTITGVGFVFANLLARKLDKKEKALIENETEKASVKDASLLIFLFGKPSLCIYRSHTAGTRSGNSLPVIFIGNITGGKNTGNICVG